jgi:hypothetical protein
MAAKGLDPKITFNTLNERYGLNLELRSYQPGYVTRYQIVDKFGNPLTEYIVAGQMRMFLKGFSKAILHFEDMNVLPKGGFFAPAPSN